jgi:hypothetical protein
MGGGFTLWVILAIAWSIYPNVISPWLVFALPLVVGGAFFIMSIMPWVMLPIWAWQDFRKSQPDFPTTALIMLLVTSGMIGALIIRLMH